METLPGIQNTQGDTATSNTQSHLQAQQALLAAFVSFFQPIMHTRVLAVAPGNNSPSDHLSLSHDLSVPDNNASAETGGMIEGTKLLFALEEFITVTVRSHFIEQRDIPITNQKKDDDISEQPTVANAVNATQSPIPSLPMTISANTQKLEFMLRTKLRRHVYNKMPVRIIMFDSNGSELQLIGRDEMFRRILPKACAEVAQAEINFADGQEWDVYKKRTKWIADLVERNARYAILSHTWIRDQPGDVVFQDWESRTRNPRGYAKITNFCEVAAREHGVAFGWIDSACINKESSSELDESIRSMYKWYREAFVCVTYLSNTHAHVLEDLHKDSWFTRGWTLQELLAPKRTHYYDTDWVALLYEDVTLKELPFFLLGHPSHVIQRKIRDATGVTEDELKLCRDGKTDKIPVSRIMQLAAKREVTREEDASYSLMGLLGVEIPVAYGEGSERALFRLIRELLTSRHHVLDIFNHGYRLFSRKIIPSTIMQYTNRSIAFDTPGSEMTSLLDKWQPVESIILTHLGVRLPLLLMPALAETTDNRCVPYGDLFGEAQLHIHSAHSVSEVKYHLLHRVIYTDLATLVAPSLRKNPNEAGPLIATFGVLNFAVDSNDSIILPRECLSLPLDCGTIMPGTVGPSDSIKIIAASMAPVFRLDSGKNVYIIPKAELKQHGIQFITLNLH